MLSSDRYLRLCLGRLMDLDKIETDAEYNWASQCKRIFVEVGQQELWDRISAKVISENYETICNNLRQSYLQEDIRILESSTRFNHYKSFSNVRNNSTPFYLTAEAVTYSCRKLISQFRLNTDCLYWNRKAFLFDESKICSYCNLHAQNSFVHFVFNCPIHTGSRNTYLKNQHRSAFWKTIDSRNTDFLLSICSYTKEALARLQLFDELCND